MQPPLFATVPLSAAPLAGIGPLAYTEMFVIAMAALMIFGSRLPEVALRAVAHIMRARRAVTRMWRETGLEDELRRVRRDIELNLPREADFDVKPPRAVADSNEARAAAERAREAAAQATREAEEQRVQDGLAGLDDADDGLDPDADRMDEVRIEPSEGIVAAGDSWEDDPQNVYRSEDQSDRADDPRWDPMDEDPSGPPPDPATTPPRFGQGVDDRADGSGPRESSGGSHREPA